MKREREAARLLRKAADILERRKVMTSMNKRARKEFPYTREQIEGLQSYLEELFDKEEKKIDRAFQKYLKDHARWEKEWKKGKADLYDEPDFFNDNYHDFPLPVDKEFEVRGFTLEIAPDPEGQAYSGPFGGGINDPGGVTYSDRVYLIIRGGEHGEESVHIGNIITTLDDWYEYASIGYAPEDYEDIVDEWEED